jgi:hypothetical protein
VCVKRDKTRLGAACHSAKDSVEPLLKPTSIARGIERPELPDLGRPRRFEQRVEVIEAQWLEHHEFTFKARRQVMPHEFDHGTV